MSPHGDGAAPGPGGGEAPRESAPPLLPGAAAAPVPGLGAPAHRDAPGRLDARKALAVLAAFALIQAIVAVAVWLALVASLALAGGDLAADTHLRQSFERLAGPLGLAGAVLAGLALAYATLLRGEGPLWIDWRREEGLSPGTPGRNAAGLLLGLLAGAGYVLLAGWLSPLPVDHEPGPLTTMAREGGRLRLVWTAAALLYAPLFEEFLFRGVLYGGLARSWGALAAAVVTSSVFVGLHYLEFAGYWPAAAGVGSLALLTLALRITTRSLGPAVSGHLGYNLSMVLLAWAVGP